MLNVTKDHYKPFSELFGKETNEGDRPSLKFSISATEADKAHKALLVSQKVRESIKCENCKRPRCIYASTKLIQREKYPYRE